MLNLMVHKETTEFQKVTGIKLICDTLSVLLHTYMPLKVNYRFIVVILIIPRIYLAWRFLRRVR
jgi:glucose-6-phosphate-specific signal transduction histidine kinase